MTPQNRSFCHGDNLPCLRGLPSDSIHLIARNAIKF